MLVSPPIQAVEPVMFENDRHLHKALQVSFVVSEKTTASSAIYAAGHGSETVSVTSRTLSNGIAYFL